jgi:hypothetical protein
MIYRCSECNSAPCHLQTSDIAEEDGVFPKFCWYKQDDCARWVQMPELLEVQKTSHNKQIMPCSCYLNTVLGTKVLVVNRSCILHGYMV